ncbi:zf-CCHC domain-containing protein, partial [Tanacetum coccineum]
MTSTSSIYVVGSSTATSRQQPQYVFPHRHYLNISLLESDIASLKVSLFVSFSFISIKASTFSSGGIKENGKKKKQPLKALDEGFSSKNYVRKFLRALHPKWRVKVTAIEESKDLSSLALDKLIGNLKVHEVVMEKDSEIYRGKKERVKSIALKAKKKSSDDETSTSGSDDEEYMDEKKGKSDRKCFRCDDPHRLIGDCLKPPRNKDQKAFIGGSWSDSENDVEDKTNNETCLMAQSSNE